MTTKTRKSRAETQTTPQRLCTFDNGDPCVGHGGAVQVQDLELHEFAQLHQALVRHLGVAQHQLPQAGQEGRTHVTQTCLPQKVLSLSLASACLLVDFQ